MALKQREPYSLDNLNQMQRYVAEETYEEYQEGHMSRRRMLRRMILICGSLPAASAFLAACGDTPTATTVATTAAAQPTTSAATTAAATTAAPTTAVATTAAPTTAAATTAAATTSAATTAAATTSAATTAAATTAPAGTTAAGTTAAGSTTAAGGTAAAGATTAPPAPTPGPAKGPLTVAENDPAVTTSDVTFKSDTDVKGYLAKPSAPGTYPGIIVIHENRGLQPHIKDVARRLAKQGYIALAPDLVSRSGGTDANQFDRISGILSQANPADLVKDLRAAVAYLETQGIAAGKLGVTGFCLGGSYTLRLAAAEPKIVAAVPYYGPTPEPASQMANTNAAIYAQYGENDARVNNTIPALEQAMKGANKTFQSKIYPGANHAFNNDTGVNFNEAAAVQAWTETLNWFQKYLKS
jgi:carboxymethylenebutenolidase